MKVAVLSKQEAIQVDKQLQVYKDKDTDIFVISIVDPQNENPKFLSAKAQLNMKFTDTNNNSQSSPQLEDAIEIINFINHIPKENSFLIVHCEQGISRSAAVGLFAYAFHYGIHETRNEFKEFFSRIQPNERMAKLMDLYSTDWHDVPFYKDEFYDFVKEINTMDVYGLRKWI